MIAMDDRVEVRCRVNDGSYGLLSHGRGDGVRRPDGAPIVRYEATGLRPRSP
jgi:hypothetical protein